MLEKLVTEDIIQNGFTTHVNNLLPPSSNPPTIKRKRNLPGTPDPEAEVIALSPKTLMATNRFLCEICGKGFQRDQNLQLHRRGHNLPWKLKQRTSKEVRKRVYVCPEKSCVHNHPSRALGDLTGIKKHFCRKHGEKKWKCAKCSKCYAVQSDWKAHSKTCGTREYKCDCGTIFSRRDSFITHRAFCDALAEETARVSAASHHFNNNVTQPAGSLINYHFVGPQVLSGQTMMAQHSEIFKPIPTNNQLLAHENHNLEDGLSLLNNNNNDNNDLREMPHQINLFVDPNQNHQPNWFEFGSVRNNNLDHQENINLSAPPPSLFTIQNHLNQSSAASMSATALLQKAAQIGSTTSTSSATTRNNQLLLGSNFGLKSNNNDNGIVQVQEQDKFCGLYGTTTTRMTDTGIEVEFGNDFTSLDKMCPPSKRRHIQIEDHNNSLINITNISNTNNNNNNNNNTGHTRDFLGVGIQPMCHPSMRFDNL
uniref:zinc finger protein MAGPIE-like n=1 Tax=Erigeron canadensis TaxID=72917 RepID=UPI001CB95FE6|nr:zinc finger protein MAGPIE-like [Erigeron canadensis]